MALGLAKFFNYVFYGVALLALCLGITLLVLYARKSTSSPSPAPIPIPTPTPIPTPNNFERLPNISLLDNGDGKIVRVAMAYAQSAAPYVGVHGNIAVWQPFVEYGYDMSLNVVGCLAENVAIYVGYGVSHEHFGDWQSRLFLGTSIFGMNCLNNANCSGFVQVDFTHNLNDILDVSSYEDSSKHRTLHVSIDKDRDDSGLGWWISFNSTRMGYIREDMFPNMLCKQVLWGGILATPAKPDFTEMGNGHFPSEGPLKTGEITYAVSITKDNSYNIEQDKKIIVTSPQCYDFQILEGGDHFLYGGSGYLNINCT